MLEAGKIGEVYNIGCSNEKSNLCVINMVCVMLDKERLRKDGKPYAEKIAFVKDGVKYDQLAAIDSSKITKVLGWKTVENLESGISKTVHCYLVNKDWVNSCMSAEYKKWVQRQYAA